MNLTKWLSHRAGGMRPNFGDANRIMKSIYTSLEPHKTWNDLYPADLDKSEYGAVFNLEFSPEGNILAAACERKAIILFDAVTQKQTQRIMEAHTDNVNCIKFLDSRTFATCSDDTTVAIWDLRCLKNRLRSLQGHSNWVKNIEYSTKDKLLVTSGFDGSIFTWDINSHTEEGLIYQKVFNTSGLMRCRISPDSTKLVICTTGGYLMIIHHLDLTTLHKDLCGFRPSIYRLMQLGDQYIPQAAKFDHLFSKNQKRNRVELVTDFPDNNNAEVILALQIHPKGLSFLSRNISYDEQSEWSCVHDLNEESYDITTQKPETRKRKFCEDDDVNDRLFPSLDIDRFRIRTDVPDRPSTSAGLRPTVQSILRRTATVRGRICNNSRISRNIPNSPGSSSSGVSFSRASSSRYTANSRSNPNYRGLTSSRGSTSSRGGQSTRNSPSSRANLSYENSPSSQRDTAHNDNNASSSTNSRLNNDPNAINTVNENTPRRSAPSNRTEFAPDIWAAEITIQERAAREANGRPTNSVTGFDFVYAISSGILPFDEYEIPIKDLNILQNPRKLMYYVEESNEGKGFIKEPSFSSDGRIICSPHNTGVRLFSYSQDCSEHPQVYEKEDLKRNPKQLVEVKNINCHSDMVLSSSFSPTQPLLVTGCKLGKVTWHYPLL